MALNKTLWNSHIVKVNNLQNERKWKPKWGRRSFLWAFFHTPLAPTLSVTLNKFPWLSHPDDAGHFAYWYLILNYWALFTLTVFFAPFFVEGTAPFCQRYLWSFQYYENYHRNAFNPFWHGEKVWTNFYGLCNLILLVWLWWWHKWLSLGSM